MTATGGPRIVNHVMQLRVVILLVRLYQLDLLLSFNAGDRQIATR